MCQLEFSTEPCPNAEYMSPGGHMTKLPVLQCGAFVVSELEPIIHLVEKKGVSLTHFLDADEKNDLRAYLCLTEKIFTNAEVISFIFCRKLFLGMIRRPTSNCSNIFLFKLFLAVHKLDR